MPMPMQTHIKRVGDSFPFTTHTRTYITIHNYCHTLIPFPHMLPRIVCSSFTLHCPNYWPPLLPLYSCPTSPYFIFLFLHIFIIIIIPYMNQSIYMYVDRSYAMLGTHRKITPDVISEINTTKKYYMIGNRYRWMCVCVFHNCNRPA